MIAKSYHVGQPITVKISGIPKEATVKAVLETPEGLNLIVDFGHEQVATAVVERDIVRE
jgi:hypothetical protein